MKLNELSISGGEIKAIRKGLGHSQATFASALGFSRKQTISDYETGRKVPNQTAIILMLKLAEGDNRVRP